jgi:hypothetical protein
MMVTFQICQQKICLTLHLMVATDWALIGACQKIVERSDVAGILDHFVPTASPEKNAWILRLSTGIPSYSTASLLVRFAESAKSQTVRESWLGAAVSVVEHMNPSPIFQIAGEAALSDRVHSALLEIIAKLVEPEWIARFLEALPDPEGDSRKEE